MANVNRIKVWYFYDDTSIFKRIVAMLIDLACIFIVIYIIYFLLKEYFINENEYVLSVFFNSSLLIGFLIRDSLFNGHSIGKRIFLYKVYGENDEYIKVNVIISIKRNITLLLPFVDLFLMLKGKRRLGDVWANTTINRQNILFI